ncbi:MAG: hemerythrin domain-containing protein [Gammaproteobacteria bacterium]
MADTIYDVLKKEHDEAKEILEKLVATSTDDAKTRRDVGGKLIAELISHHEAESQTLYQRLMDFEDLRDHVEEHQDEHEEANKELRALLDVDVEEAAWLERLKEIKEAVEHHIEDEEERLFPEAREHLDESEAEELAGQFEEEQTRRKELLKVA